MYLDTSFLLKVYISEAESPEATTLLNQLRGDGVVSPLSDVEVVAALSRRLSLDDGQRVVELYRSNRSMGLFRLVELDAEVYELASNLAGQYAKRFSLRSLNLLHLATTMHHRIPTLGTYDKPLAEAARAEGIAGAFLKRYPWWDSFRCGGGGRYSGAWRFFRGLARALRR